MLHSVMTHQVFWFNSSCGAIVHWLRRHSGSVGTVLVAGSLTPSADKIDCEMEAHNRLPTLNAGI